VTLLRPLVHLVGFIWAMALSLLALGVALFCLDGLVPLGAARPDRLLDLPSVRRSVGRFLAQLEASGHVAALSLLCGLAAVGVGVVIIWGLLGRPGQRVAVLDEDALAGVLAVRRRTLGQLLRSLVEERDELLAVRRVKVRLHRRGSGGRVRIDAVGAGAGEEAEAGRSVEGAIAPLTGPLSLKAHTRIRAPRERSEAGAP
jgi:hypothetical protein